VRQPKGVHLQFVSAGGKNFNDTTRAHVSVCFSAHGGERNGGAEDCALPLFAAPLINDHRIIITLSLSLSLSGGVCALGCCAPPGIPPRHYYIALFNHGAGRQQ